VTVPVRSCSQLIQREPDSAAAYNSRAAAYATKGDYTSAVADAVKAGELSPKKNPQAIAARTVPRPKAAPAMTEGTLPAWAQTLFGKAPKSSPRCNDLSDIDVEKLANSGDRREGSE